MRGQGLGRQLLQRVDEVAQKRSCRAISVDTAGENNKLFYEKNGYQVFGQLEGYPQGFTKFYLKKEIACVEASGKEKEK